MDRNEVLRFLNWKKETFEAAISTGIEIPRSKTKAVLKATKIGESYHVDDGDLDSFQKAFEEDEPGRHPPTAVMRALLVESSHRCGICKQALPIQFHHIIEWNEIKHYDVDHMLSVCGGCHDLCGLGRIDRLAQKAYKRRLSENRDEDVWGRNAASLPWDELAEVIELTHQAMTDANPSSESKFDYSYVDLETIKNPLNKLRKEYFALMREMHEPHFRGIDDFLRSPGNPASETYYRLVDALRRRMAHYQLQSQQYFEAILLDLEDAALKRFPELKKRSRTLSILLSFMYFNCDIGLKA